jgi:hypothetical protein
MNKKQSNYLGMTKTTLALMETKRSEWETDEPINETVTNVTGHVNTLEAENKKREEMKTTGLTEDKNMVFENMCQKAYKIATKLKAYAKRTKNNTLLVAVDYTETSIKAGTEQAVLTRCQTVHQKAVDNAEALIIYKITPEMITGLEAAIEAFKPLTSNRDSVGDERVAKTVILNETIGKIREELDILDDLVEGTFDDEFIDAYHSARQIIDR